MKIKIPGIAILLLMVVVCLTATTYEIDSFSFATKDTMDCRHGQQAVAVISNSHASQGMVVRILGYGNYSGSNTFALTLESETQLTLEAGEKLLFQTVKPWAKLDIQVKSKVSGQTSEIQIERQVKK